MDVAPFSLFDYKDKHALDDFLLVNALAHENVNTALAVMGLPPFNLPLTEIGPTQEGIDDWLQSHWLAHKHLAITVGLPSVPDLSDVELHDQDEFENWLQLHAQQHQLLDATLNL